MRSFSQLAIVSYEFLPFTGGIATYAANLAAAAHAHGVETRVFAPRYLEDDTAFPYPVSRVLHHQSLSPHKTFLLLARLLTMPREIFWHGADIRAALILYAAHLVTLRPYAVTIHGSEVLKLSGRGWGVKLARNAYRRASIIFANSQATAEIFTREIPHPHVRVTPLGVAEDCFSPPPAQFENTQITSFLAHSPCVLTVGRLEPRKGHDQVIEALKRLKTEGKEIGYIIAGPTIDTDYRRALERAATEADLPVLFTDAVSDDDLRRLYNLSLCHILWAREIPGKIEGFGLVLLEASAQGCPSIATRVGGIPEVVREGETGFLMEEDDLDALVSTLPRMMEDHSMRESMGARARQHAKSFTWNACAEATYQGILEGYAAEGAAEHANV